MIMQSCPACQGRRVVPNAENGNPCVCPLCEGQGQVEPSLLRLPFFYAVNLVLTANQTRNTALNLQARADFEWIWGMSTQTGTFTTEITDSSGRGVQDNAVNNANLWGTAQLPFALIVPWTLAASSSLALRIIDTSGGGNTVQMVLAGYELYPVN